MVEVFKTNVTDGHYAEILVTQIHRTYPDYNANFDLEDCDRILRIKCAAGSIDPHSVIDLLTSLGFRAEVLPDEPAISAAYSIRTGQRYIA